MAEVVNLAEYRRAPAGRRLPTGGDRILAGHREDASDNTALFSEKNSVFSALDGPARQREIERVERIRDSVEDLLNMVAGLRRDPESVALAATRFGVMRSFQLHGRQATMDFVSRCIDTAEIAEDLFGPR